jgi:hypothetical protein
VAAGRRLAGRRLPGRLGRPAALLAFTGLGAVAGLFVYLSFLLVTGAGIVVPIGPAVAGRPLPWLVLQLLAAVAVVAAGTTAVRAWWTRREVQAGARVQLGLLLAGGSVFVPWAVYWGLLRP